jgi:PAS domain S-box-containing protein
VESDSTNLFRDAPDDNGFAVNAELYLSEVLNSLSDSIVGMDLTGRITTWSRASDNVLGYAKEEMIGRSIMRMVPPALRRDEAEILRRLAAGDVINPYESSRVKKDGESVDVAVTVYTVKDDTGRVIGAVHRCRTAAACRGINEGRYQLAAIVDSADDAIVTKNLDGVVVSWNRAAALMFGYTAEEIVGQSLRRIIPGERQLEEDEILRKLKTGERIDHFETLLIRKSGEPIGDNFANPR